ncbi:biotin--[acetyl-CoA-carboxylase] ligase [Nostocoides sp. F2B08]|uniref:biotin--[acetyl-CoA-carboxylase] ligase n=1 Tax=Nostocoides sp. F2B08 TaxID=2653936 RepID=UPI001262B38B|nr:biotin--[acetyl-CoA-carboxylase] ligase [Tetrasphaera sp. F2B08]KAB7741939.1 biotin--[acetyl-CoA-carboxylase] ligase [Tetrasphaera sp. F2B08]
MRAPLQVRTSATPLPPPWRSLTVVDETPSTNADLAEAAKAGEAAPWAVLVTEHQSAGRGRLGRTWTSVRGAALTFSALVPTPAAPGWVPLIAGLAVADAIEEVYAVRPALKWPNDVLGPVGGVHEGRKLAGILCELTGRGIVVGIGLNVDHTQDELPVPTATSLRLMAGSDPASTAPPHPDGVTRDTVLLAILTHLADLLSAWESDPGRVRTAYRGSCSTLGRRVRIDRGTGSVEEAEAVEVDEEGRLVVLSQGRRSALAAGDVTHVR